MKALAGHVKNEKEKGGVEGKVKNLSTAHSIKRTWGGANDSVRGGEVILKTVLGSVVEKMKKTRAFAG